MYHVCVEPLTLQLGLWVTNLITNCSGRSDITRLVGLRTTSTGGFRGASVGIFPVLGQLALGSKGFGTLVTLHN